MKDMNVFFIDKELFPFSELLAATKRKHVGLDDYWLAVAMMKVEELGPLPRMLKPLVVDELIEFFLSAVKTLMK